MFVRAEEGENQDIAIAKMKLFSSICEAEGFHIIGESVFIGNETGAEHFLKSFITRILFVDCIVTPSIRDIASNSQNAFSVVDKLQNEGVDLFTTIDGEVFKTTRTIPFGYKFENGAVVIEESTADIVKEIYNRYLSGDSMLNISELLNKLHVEYTPGITGWNKARIKRILENKKYLGNEDFPPIIDEDIALRADEIREVRNKQKNVNKEELIYNLTAETICPCCGTVMKRRFDPRTKIHGRWRCQRSDCRKLVAITDEVMLTEITELLEHLSKHPENILLPPEEGSINLESLRIENEIKRMLDSRQINKEELRTKMLESASLSYSGLNNKIYITQRLTKIFENHCPTGSFPMELFDQSVSEISFDEKDNVTITLINGQILRKEQAYAAS